MIDKEKIREALQDIKIFDLEKTFGVDILKDLAEQYLAGKLVEPMSEEEIKKMINEWTVVSVIKNGKEIWNCNGLETEISKKEKLTAEIKSINTKALVGHIGKREEK